MPNPVLYIYIPFKLHYLAQAVSFLLFFNRPLLSTVISQMRREALMELVPRAQLALPAPGQRDHGASPALSVPCSSFRRLDFCAGASPLAQPFPLLDLSTRVLLLEFPHGPQRSPSASALCVSGLLCPSMSTAHADPWMCNLALQKSLSRAGPMPHYTPHARPRRHQGCHCSVSQSAFLSAAP